MKAGRAWLAAGLGWLAGCAVQLQMAALWPAPWAWVLLSKGAVLAFVGWRFRVSRWGVALLAAGAVLLGFSVTHLRAEWRLADGLDAALEGQDIVITGTVAGLPREGPDGTRFLFDTDSATWQGRSVRVPSKLSLGWYRGADEDMLLGGPGEAIRAGQQWRLTVRLKRPHGLMNPGGFDLELWLWEQGIRGGGYVRAKLGAVGESTAKLAERKGHWVDRARQDWRDAINARVTDSMAAGVLAALAIGDQAAIDRDDWDLFRVTGVAHLMSISGLHVTMFAWLAGLLVARLWRTQPRWMLAVPTPTAARWGGLLAALGYALLAGWGVPAQRTVWMIAAVVLLRQAGLRWPLHAVLLAAAVVVTLLDPWALMQPGFWLSFVAVALLVASEPVRQHMAQVAQGWWARAVDLVKAGLRTQLVATAGLAPLSMAFFQQISLVGFVANLVAIPVVTLLITPLALLGVLAPPLWTLAAWCSQQLSAYLELLSSAPWAVWQAAAAPPWAVAAGLLGGLLAVLPLPWRLRLLAVPLLLPLLAPPVPRPAPGDFELVAADVGQGTAVLVRTANHLLVYDTGPQYSRDADAGGRVLVPLLRARGEDRVDLLMLSHRDADHVGGAATLLRALPVAAIRSSLADAHPLRQDRPPHDRCTAGQRWDWDGVQFQVLHPTPEDYTREQKSNAMSCVLRVQGAHRTVLLTGDAEAPQEAAMLARDPAALKADVLVVPHHGSRTSSTPAFIDAVAPQTAIFQAAYRSRYGHPAPDVVARYRERGITLVRSDFCGAWAQPPQHGVQGYCVRQSQHRYWHHPGNP